MAQDLAHLLYDGARAVQEGRLDEGRELLMKLLELDENNEQAWLWLSGAVEDPADQQIALENVLLLNPQNQAAREGLEWLKQQPPQKEPLDAAIDTKPSAPQPEAASPSKIDYRTSVAPLPTDENWSPPLPWDDEDVVEITCWKCNATLYSVAPFCWQCHTPVHSCNNCYYRNVTKCKELRGFVNTLAQSQKNDCVWWHPVP